MYTASHLETDNTGIKVTEYLYGVEPDVEFDLHLHKQTLKLNSAQL